MAVTPPPFQSNYPRGPQQGFGYLRPPGVYFDSLGTAWEMMKSDLGTYIVCSLILTLAFGVVYMGMVAIQLTSGTASMFQPGSIPTYSASYLRTQMVTDVVGGIIIQFFMLGLISVGIGHLRQGQPKIADMFMPFRRFGKALVAVILLQLPSIAMIGVMTAGNATMDPRDPIPAFLALGIASAIGLLFFFTIYGPLLLGSAAAVWSDGKPLEAFGETFRRVGWKAPLLSILFMLAGMLAGLGVCACGIGLLFSMPILANVVALHYSYFFPPAPREGVPANPYFPQT